MTIETNAKDTENKGNTLDTDADLLNDYWKNNQEYQKNEIPTSFIQKCSSKKIKPAKNSSIMASQKAIRENIPAPPLPLPSNDYVYSYGDLNKLPQNNPLYKKYLKHPITVQEGLLEIIRKYDPNYFLTFQLPSKRRTYDYLKFEPKLKMVMHSFQWNLEGRHWNHHPVPFICFLEKGKSGYWHAHILFRSNRDIYTIKDALDKVRKGRRQNKKKLPWYRKRLTDYSKRLPTHSFNIQSITKHAKKINPVYNFGVEMYCIKEIDPDCEGHFDGDKMILGENLLPTP